MLKNFCLVFLCGFSLFSVAQENFTISGTLKDASSGEDIIGARISVVGVSGKGAISNTYGFYSLTLPKGSYTIQYKSLGYVIDSFKVALNKNIVKNVELVPEARMTDVVNVTTQREDENITSGEMGVEKLSIKDIETIPVIFGEKDIFKTMQLLPGVKSAGEGNSGFYVRGGGSDQNLILLDGAPVYNASHLLGFFSVFNSDALKDVKLYKGGAPAEFGGRLSSVMDIKMKEGNSKQFSFSGGLGIISSRLTIEGPIVKNKGSFIISGRRTYVDMFLKLSNKPELNASSLYFYDLNAKANYKFGEKDRIFISGYFGRDNFGFGELFSIDWGNTTGTLRWNHIYSDKLFGNTSVIFSNYDYKIKFGSGNQTFQIGSQIQDFNVKEDFDWYINSDNTFKFGTNVIHHTFKPGEIETGTGINFELNDIEKRYSLESSVYVSNEQKIKKRLVLIYGLRFDNFTQIGPGDFFTYDNEGNVTDTTTIAKGKPVKSYNGLSPRFSVNYIIDEKSSVKASYGRTYQFLHLISNTTSSTPTDIWLPSSSNVKPEIADQFAVGYFRNFNNNMFELSAEFYYKAMQNTIDYRDGAEVTLNPTIEGELLYGIGRAYGAELLFRKRKGKITGWVAYTISRTERLFDEINQKTWYPAKQDRLHDISIVGIYAITERINVSATWVYYTGNAVTFPSGKYEVDGQIINYYSERNGYRMPNYHRMDVGLTLYNKDYKMVADPETGVETKVTRRWESSWNISCYNVYAHENAYQITFKEDPATGKTEAYQLALFKIIPSITYNFKF